VLSSESIGRIDVLKVDVDGFDGEVLAGAMRILKKDRPGVIFEWHPVLYEKTGNSWRAPFEVLDECGYTGLLWYTNEGFFSHFTKVNDFESFEKAALLCLGTKAAGILHYDIVALPRDAANRWLETAELSIQKRRLSHF
jgi:hypothetical protein